MSQAAQASRPAPTSTWHMYRAMVGVGVCCGLLIVGAFQVTRPVIERNRAAALQSAILQVLTQATTTRAFRLDQSGSFSPASGEGDGEALIYAGYDDDEKLVGLAIEARGMGYQDVISLIYGYSFAEQAIIGIEVLESKETPGLGDKIETDPEFLKSFERLDASLVEDQSALAHPIVAVKRGKKTNPWEVDGITGATISSQAIADILNGSAQRWAPLIQRNLRGFQGGD